LKKTKAIAIEKRKGVLNVVFMIRI